MFIISPPKDRLRYFCSQNSSCMGDVIHVILLCTVRCGHQTPQLPKFRSLGVLRNVTFMLQVEEKSYTEFVFSENRTRIFLVESQYVTTELTRSLRSFVNKLSHSYVHTYMYSYILGM